MDRSELINKIEDYTKHSLLCYATGDRRNIEAQIGEDIFACLYEHLSGIGRVDRLTLFIYSRGGNTLAGFALANALWEFASDVNIIVPFKAHSTATLICLSGSKIIMGPLGQLSPIDPSITTPHGPYIEVGNQRQFIPVSVEDVAGYFSLARQEAKLGDERMNEVFGHLSSAINPLALGAVFRAREQIGMLARKLLKRHLTDEAQQTRIVTALTRELLSHDYIIGRVEAKSLGLPVETPTDELSGLMWELYSSFADEMKLAQPWNPEVELGNQQVAKRTVCRALMESRARRHTFQTTVEIKRTHVVQGGTKIDAVQTRAVDEGWKKV